MCLEIDCHFVAGSCGDSGHLVTMMLQHLKGVFNWDSEQLHDAQKLDHSLDQQIGHQTGNSIIGPEVDQARLQGHKQNFVTQKKCELEGYIGKRIATLKSEEVSFIFLVSSSCIVIDKHMWFLMTL